MKNTLPFISLSIAILLLGACSEDGKSPATNQPTPQQTSQAPEGMVLIPAGNFIMGSDNVDASGKSEEFGFNEPWFLNEHPQRKINLHAFYIDKYEATNGDYKKFLEATGRYSKEEISEIIKKFKLGNEKDPLRTVTWHDANSFCKAIGKRLPTEAEWEKAARGENGFEFPWGNEWNPDYLNAGGEEVDVMPVGSYEKGKSPYGVYDMAGNVMEWVEDWYEAYPDAKYVSPRYGKKRKVVRGGGWGGIGHYVIPHFFRMAYRYNYPADKAFNDIGFRCARDADPEP